MANLVIPVSVDTGNSLQKLKQVGDGINNLNNQFGSFKQQLRIANNELINAIEKYGAYSKQAAEAGKKVSDLKDKIGDAAQISKAFNLETKFQNLSQAVQGAVGAMNILVGVQALFGDKSKQLEETLRKVQGLLALSQGLNALFQSKDAIVALNVSFKAFIKTLFETKAASQGIGIIATISKVSKSGAIDLASKLAVTSNSVVMLNKNLKITAGIQQKFLALSNSVKVSTVNETLANTKLAVSQLAVNTTSASRVTVQNSVFASTVAQAQADTAMAVSMNTVAASTANATVGLSLFKRALISTGIGLLIVALGTVVAYWDEIKASISGVSLELKKVNQDALAKLKSSEYELEILKSSEDILRQQGKSEREILQYKIKKTQQAITDQIIAIQTGRRVRNLQIEAADRNQRILAGFIDFVTLPLQAFYSLFVGTADAVMKIIRKVGSFVGIKIGFDFPDDPLKGFRESASKLIFDPKKEKQAADEATKADTLALIKLLNDKASFQNEIKNIDKDAAEKAKKTAKEKADAILEAEKIMFEARTSLMSEKEAKIAKLMNEYLEKQKTLQKAGNFDLLTFWQAYFKEKADIEKEYSDKEEQKRNEKRGKELKDAADFAKKRKEAEKQLADITFAAMLSGVKDEYQRRKLESEKNFLDEKRAVTKQYRDGLISLEEYEKAVSDLRLKYGNEQKDNLSKRLEDEQSMISDSLSTAAETFGNALAEGADPFAAAFKSITDSLGNYLIKLGKDAVAAWVKLKILKETFGKTLGLGAGLALIALGAALKASFSKKASKGFASGGFIYGPGSETSDSIPARLSRGEYVIRARSVKKYGKEFFDKFNRGIPEPEWSRALVNKSNSRALVNKTTQYSNGGYVDPFASFSRALVNRFESNPLGLDSGSRALVNRPLPDTPRIISNNVQLSNEGGFSPYIAETRISGQDLRIILSRADRRFSNVT